VPRCDTPIRAHERGAIGRTTTPLEIECKRCGTRGRYSPDHLQAMSLKWSQDEKIRIVERYWASSAGMVRCPNDKSVLKIIKRQVLQPPPQDIMFLCPLCGRNFWSQQVEELKDPDSFEGQYEILRVLGEGGMGKVLLARNRATSTEVAAKQILPQYVRDEELVRRFQREGRILASLDHPNVVAIHSTFLSDAGGTIVMQYVGGGTLTQAINARNVAIGTLLGLFDGVVAGLEYLHANNVIHRDLKPGNVLIDKMSARISDFGLSRLLVRDTTPLTARGAFVGTPFYAAPEQRKGSSEVTPACDIYSLGLVAFEVATRRSPYGTLNLTGLTLELGQAIEECLSQVPESRPSSGTRLQRLSGHILSQTEQVKQGRQAIGAPRQRASLAPHQQDIGLLAPKDKRLPVERHAAVRGDAGTRRGRDHSPEGFGRGAQDRESPPRERGRR
jgi:serine/threonine protein kinase